MAKVINIKPKEEITSVIERLWETGEEEIYLVAAKDTALLKNIIALKLLKREAERLGKEVVLITKDELGREMAKRVGLPSKIALPKAIEEESEEDEVFHEMPQGEFEHFIEEEVKERERRQAVPTGRSFSDIRPKSALVERKSIEVERKEEKIILPLEEEPKAQSELDELIRSDTQERSLPGGFSFAQLKKDLKEEETPLPDFFETAPEPPLEPEAEEDSFPIHSMAGGVRRAMAEEKKHWWRNLVSNRFKDLSERLVAQETKPKRAKKSLALPVFSGKFLSVFIGAAVLIAALALYFILPKAEITIVPKAEAIDQEITVVTDKGISKADLTQGKVPAQMIKVDKRQSQEFATTGQRQVNDKAKGAITIYNEYSSSAQALVEKTRFVSEGGQVFRLTKTVTVPGAKIQEGKIVASSIDAEVVADQAGSDYNVGPGKFTIPGFQGTPKYTAFYGQSKAAMSGGATGLMKVVAQDDFDKAKETIWQSLQPALDSDLKNQMPGALKVVDGALKEELSGAESDVAVSSPAEKFTVTVKGTATVLLFDEKDVLEIIKKKFADKLAEDKALDIKTDQVSYEVSAIDFNRGQMTLKVKVVGRLVWQVNGDSIKQEVLGRDEQSIRQIFAGHSEISEAKVAFWPFWVSSVPKNLDKIKVLISQ